jgi:hypothetical protein
MLRTDAEDGGSAGALAQFAPFAFGQATPDTEAFVIGEGVFQALGFDLAGGANFLCIAG